MPHQGKIFIVEDDPTIIKLLKDHLSANYQVETSQNFRDVRKEVEDFNPDLVLMDITLPYFNGFYWTTQIRKSKNMPIVFISSSDDEMDMVMALNMGGDDFIAKPFSLPIYLDFNGEVTADAKNYSFTHPYAIGAIRLNQEQPSSKPARRAL